MSDEDIRKMLEKQLQLLSEHSPNADDSELVHLTDAMVNLAQTILSFC